MFRIFTPFIHSIIIFLVLSFALCFNSCQKAKDKTVLISEDFKQWVYFKKGSYWIYINESTGEIDSAHVAQDPIFFYSMSYGAQNEKITVEEIWGYTESTVLKGYFLSPWYCNTIFSYDRRGICLITDFTLKNEISLEGQFFLDTTYQSYTVNELEFENVMQTRFIHTPDIHNDTLVLTFYCAKNVGLIRFIIQDQKDTTWSLMRYHVVQ